MGLDLVEAHARRVEALGYDGLCVPDAVHDGLLLSHAVLRVTTRLRAATSVLVAFPRSPMLVAIAAWDLAALSGGRFEIGFSGGSGSTTDDRGQFRIHGLMPGSYVVAVRNSIQSAAVSSLDALRAAATSGTAGAITREWPYSGVVWSSWDPSGVILGGWQATVGSGGVPPRPGPDGTLLVVWAYIEQGEVTQRGEIHSARVRLN